MPKAARDIGIGFILNWIFGIYAVLTTAAIAEAKETLNKVPVLEQSVESIPALAVLLYETREEMAGMRVELKSISKTLDRMQDQ